MPPPFPILGSAVVHGLGVGVPSSSFDSQHGFRSGRSCLTNLVDYFHDMFSIYDKSRAVDILYLDFRKAFDKVPHKRLMAKVRSLGIIDEMGDWIEDWLSDRKQRVVINGHRLAGGRSLVVYLRAQFWVPCCLLFT